MYWIKVLSNPITSQSFQGVILLANNCQLGKQLWLLQRKISPFLHNCWKVYSLTNLQQQHFESIFQFIYFGDIFWSPFFYAIGAAGQNTCMRQTNNMLLPIARICLSIKGRVHKNKSGQVWSFAILGGRRGLCKNHPVILSIFFFRNHSESVWAPKTYFTSLVWSAFAISTTIMTALKVARGEKTILLCSAQCAPLP